eukprot:TRINITY_DN16055_c0_g1_i1.p1 TRINITY_DN16055_c0_g1~~TRINITY_DN16055_c0_g1_i1.p1  ORF type:complete len:117 (-),score=27.90 TRINITY_DN16055_c0_g1_i1:76-426(-)
MSADGSVLTCASGRDVLFFSVENGDLLKSYTLPRPLTCAALHPHLATFITASNQENWVRTYDFQTGKEVDCQKGHHGYVRSLAYSPSGDTYASGSEDGTVRIWEILADAAPPSLSI